MSLIFSAALIGVAQSDPSTATDIDTARSIITVRVYKTGLFSAFAHDHEIHAPVRSGTIDEEKNSVKFVVDSRSLRVLDPKASQRERAEIQNTMLGPKVLDSERFPEVSFRSTSLGEAGAGKWIVRGELSLHGETHPVKLEVQGAEGRYTGTVELSQKEFGITPVSIAGGSVKVKDEVRIEFEIFVKQ
jgi:polyisoprenoid-binding protein YceI